MVSVGLIVGGILLFLILITAFVLSILAYIEATKETSTTPITTSVITTPVNPCELELFIASGPIQFQDPLLVTQPQTLQLLFSPSLPTDTPVVVITNANPEITVVPENITNTGFQTTTQFPYDPTSFPFVTIKEQQEIFNFPNTNIWLVFVVHGTLIAPIISAARSVDGGSTWSNFFDVVNGINEVSAWFHFSFVTQNNAGGDSRLKIILSSVRTSVSTTNDFPVVAIEAADEFASSFLPFVILRDNTMESNGPNTASLLPNGQVLVTWQDDSGIDPVRKSFKLNPDNTTTADVSISTGVSAFTSANAFSFLEEGTNRVVYYHQDGDTLLFASAADATLDIPTWDTSAPTESIPIARPTAAFDEHMGSRFSINKRTNRPNLVVITDATTVTIFDFDADLLSSTSNVITINNPTSQALPFLLPNVEFFPDGRIALFLSTHQQISVPGTVFTIGQISNELGIFDPDFVVIEQRLNSVAEFGFIVAKASSDLSRIVGVMSFGVTANNDLAEDAVRTAILAKNIDNPISFTATSFVATCVAP